MLLNTEVPDNFTQAQAHTPNTQLLEVTNDFSKTVRYEIKIKINFISTEYKWNPEIKLNKQFHLQELMKGKNVYE